MKSGSQVLCDEAPEDPAYAPPPEERPGGYDWGNNGDAENANNEDEANDNNHNQDDQFYDEDNGDNNNVLHNDENQNLQPL